MEDMVNELGEFACEICKFKNICKYKEDGFNGSTDSYCYDKNVEDCFEYSSVSEYYDNFYYDRVF